MQGATAISGEENTWGGNLASSCVSHRCRACCTVELCRKCHAGVVILTQKEEGQEISVGL